MIKGLILIVVALVVMSIILIGIFSFVVICSAIYMGICYLARMALVYYYDKRHKRFLRKEERIIEKYRVRIKVANNKDGEDKK